MQDTCSQERTFWYIVDKNVVTNQSSHMITLATIRSKTFLFAYLFCTIDQKLFPGYSLPREFNGAILIL